MWYRPSGPPHVWRIIKIRDSNGKIRKFSMQEIPEDRYDEVLDHMCKFFIRDENLCRSLNMKDELASINQFKETWMKILSEGISVGAFELVDNDKPVLAGLNILYYGNDEIEEVFDIYKTRTSRAAEMVVFSMDSCAKADPRKLYGVDHYLGALGLSVDPQYRGLGLGYELLALRDNVCRAYNIEYTTTIFSSPAAQKSAAKAGFEVYYECSFNEIPCKVMGKRIF